MPPHRRPRAVTITDVARAAGVAPSTVSRAFTRPDRVNAVTREHVLAGRRAAWLPAQPGRPGARQSGAPAPWPWSFPTSPTPTSPASSRAPSARRRRPATPRHRRHQENRAGPSSGSWRRLGRVGRRLRADRLEPDAATQRLRPDRRAAPGRAGQPADSRRHQRGPRPRVGDRGRSSSTSASLGHRGVLFLAGPPESWLGRPALGRAQCGGQAAAD